MKGKMPARAARQGFVRGFTASGLIAIFGAGKGGLRERAVLRAALQGGLAMASGTAAAEAVGKDRWLDALTAIAAGAAGMVVLDTLCKQDSKRTTVNGKEEEQTA